MTTIALKKRKTGNSERHDAEPLKREVPRLILASAIRMLLAINFDADLCLRAVEVKSVRTDRMLATEEEAAKPPFPKKLPDDSFRCRSFAPQFPNPYDVLVG